MSLTLPYHTTQEGIRRPGAKTPPLPNDGNAILSPPKRQQQRPASLQLTSSSWKSANGNHVSSSSLLDDGDNVYEPPMSAREIRSTGKRTSKQVTRNV